MRVYERLGVVADWGPARRIVHIGPTKDPVYDAENARLLLGTFERLIPDGGAPSVSGRFRPLFIAGSRFELLIYGL